MNRYCLLILFALCSSHVLSAQDKEVSPTSGESYHLFVEGFDWGAAFSRVLVKTDKVQKSFQKDDFVIRAHSSTDCSQEKGGDLQGERHIIFAYPSDENGKRVNSSEWVTLVMEVGPDLQISKATKYYYNDQCKGTVWIDYALSITQKSTLRTWNREERRFHPELDKFDLSGSFSYGKGEKMRYASFTPQTDNKKSPLIIWLHGGGEGGYDPSIALMGNKATHYASDEIQHHFDGAYVLVPQCPGAWMDNEEGIVTMGKEEDVYHKPLLALIKDFVDHHEGIDRKRIYLGGCSNGGYMTLKLMLQDPDYFAAGFVSSSAYFSKYISDEGVKSIKKKPIWFAHSKDDNTTKADETAIPLYHRLKEAGAKNVYLSLFDHVIDISGSYGGEAYHYNGHLSWIYVHENECRLDIDGKPVKWKGKPTSMMPWLAAQSN
ncbi:MAG: prolyl oligopeptidase family serine peptidase [Bacteroidota bacterium]